MKILDVGCGKGRFLRNLIREYPQHEYFGLDLSKKVMEYANDLKFDKREGSMTNIPHEDNKFDIVYACESLEHAIEIKNAIREMTRVLRPGGKLIIIDKDIEELGASDIDTFEQWFDKKELSNVIEKYCDNVEASYILLDNSNDKNSKSLFVGWKGIKKY